MGFIKPITGRQITTHVSCELADLGIARWDAQRGANAVCFGDNFSFSWGQDWQSPSILMYDDDYNCLGIPTTTGIASEGMRRQTIPYTHNQNGVSTVLPCDFIRVNGAWHMAAMVVGMGGLGNELATEFWQSRNLVDWAKTDVSHAHPGHPGSVMITFDELPDGYVYIFGTGGLSRNQPVWMWRNKTSEFPHSLWEPYGFDGRRWDWNIPNETTPILSGDFGELCFRYIQGNCVLSFFDVDSYCQTALTVPNPTDDWTAANQCDYAHGPDFPQIYGGYITPASKLNATNGMQFLVSQWATATNDPYHVCLFTHTLEAQGPLVEAPSDRVDFVDTGDIPVSSENGWNPARLAPGADELEWITVPGTDVSLQLMKGAPLLIMRAYAADYNAYVERLRDADSAAYTPTNAVATSNHLNATAMDLNWQDHSFQVSYAGYTQPMIDTMRELLDYYEGTMFWAQDWDSPKDCMHHQMGYDTWNSPATGDFIARKIRVDGYSTFRRGDLPYPTPGLTQADQYAMTIIDEGRKRGVSERGQKIAISTALVESQLKNYANVNVPESMNIPHDAVGSDHDSVGLFQQRCPMWGPANVLMDPAQSAGLFYDHLVRTDYNGPESPGTYAQQVQRSAFPDRYDQRFADAVEIFNRVTAGAPAAPAPTPVPPPVAVPAPPAGGAVPLSEAEQRELLDRVRQIWAALFNPVTSQSRYADPNMVWAPKDFWRNDDGFLYDLITEHDATLGDSAAIARIQKAAAAGDRIAQQFLTQPQAPAASTPTPAPTPVPVVYTAPPPPPAPVPVTYTAPPPPAPVPATYTVTPQVPPMSFHDAVDSFAAQLQQIKTAMAKLIGGPPE